jgi:ATP-dependent Lon protease
MPGRNGEGARVVAGDDDPVAADGGSRGAPNGGTDGVGAPTPVEVVTEPTEPTESAPDGAEMVRRGDRFPPNLFVLALPGVVVFPEFTLPLVLRTPWAERTVAQAASQSEFIGVVVHKSADAQPNAPKPDELHPHGCLVRILRSLQMPDGTRTLLVQGIRRFRIERYLRTEPYLIAKVAYPDEVLARGDEIEALTRNVRQLLRQVVESSAGGDVQQEMGVAVLNIERKGALADFAASFLIKAYEVRCELLAELDIQKRLMRVAEELTRELQMVTLGNRIQETIRKKIEERQQEFFLREQLKAIRKELGEGQDERELEVDELKKRMAELPLPPAAKEKAQEDLRRLASLSSDSPEAAVLRGYLDWLFAMPFGKETPDTHDLAAARRILDRDHFGLDEIKERMVEFLAVRQRLPAHKGPILCLLGPPGVGKTSLGRSIADALGRKFVRVSLGGVRDEAEIRGHRRTYVGAQPGRIVRGMKGAGSMNPVFMLDEIDKLGNDFRGDPGSALLEALDPEQNNSFSDHYLEVPLDLSKVFFIATANEIDPIPAALRDRLEVIELNGYVTEEKVAIAAGFLLPRQRANHGLAAKDVKITRAALAAIVRLHTREAGVRGLEKQIARICRKLARELGEKTRRRAGVVVDVADLPKYLGASRFPPDRLEQQRPPGVAIGLAWTPVGGEVLEIQAMLIPDARKGLEITGMLGDVMNESARIAVSYVLAHHVALGISDAVPKDKGLHLHVPAGAVRKDGPSAGVTMVTALVSLLTDRPVRPELAMTGEITLTGQVLAVGGIRDKVLAAKRLGIREVLLPGDNRKDVDEIRPQLRRGMKFHFVEKYPEVLALAFRGGRAKAAAANAREARTKR